VTSVASASAWSIGVRCLMKAVVNGELRPPPSDAVLPGCVENTTTESQPGEQGQGVGNLYYQHAFTVILRRGP
jgi:hypothetical protein